MTSIKKAQQWIRDRPALMLAYIGIMVSLIAVAQGVAVRSDQDIIEEASKQNKEIACAIADLIAYVPAIQFEGESRRNFINWIDSRRSLLDAARVEDTCSPKTIRALVIRKERDARLLEKLRRDR